MTLSRMETKNDVPEKNSLKKKPRTIGQALQNLVKEASTHGRVSCGVLECAQVLRRTPKKVMLCILQRSTYVNTDQHIHRKLIEAYCREYKVRLLQVDSCTRLMSSLRKDREANAVTAEDNRTPDFSRDLDLTTSDDYSTYHETECLLIETSDIGYADEDFVLTYYDTVVYCNASHCISVPID